MSPIKFNRYIALQFMLVCCILGLMVVKIKAQPEQKGEFWMGYISSVRYNDKIAIWNDFHFLTQAFFASRQGITYSFQPNLDITAGYAWVTTATNFSNDLIRPEHRIWGQIEWRKTLSRRFSFRSRLRYDGRFRKNLFEQEVVDEVVFSNRYRMMNSIRYKLFFFNNGSTIHLNVMDEVLLQSSRMVELNLLDQNRFYLMPGYTMTNFTLMAGYHLRFIPVLNGNNKINHGFTIWVIQNFNFRKPSKSSIEPFIEP